MNKLLMPLLIMILGMPLIFTACIKQPASVDSTISIPKKVETPVQKSEWENLAESAKKEGAVVIYGNLKPKAMDTITPAFKEKYGINIEWIVGRPDELLVRVKSERNAGLYFVDMGLFGAPPNLNDLIPMDITPSLEPMLVLPEVKDPKNWRGNKLPFLDKEKKAIYIVLVACPFYFRNTDLVKDGEITTSPDLLNPKWGEKLAVSDPSISGNSNSWFAWTLMGIMSREKGQQFMKDLAAQKPIVTRDERLLTEWVARGKYHIGIGPSISLPAEFIKLGAPIAFIDAKETRVLSPGAGVINVFKNAPHPNAAKLFLNWILTKEGSSIFAPAQEFPSVRVDVPPEGILPILVPRPDDIFAEEKYEGWSATKREMLKIAEDIFSSSPK